MSRQSFLPADVNESRCDKDHADRPNYHQNYKQFAIVAVCLTRQRLTTVGCTVVLNANLKVEDTTTGS